MTKKDANGIAWLSNIENQVDDALRQLDALNEKRLTHRFITEGGRPSAILRLRDEIEEIRLKKPKGLWDYAGKFRSLESGFAELLENEKTRKR
jgi:hypothetical protein